jgi:hypothetical protein
MGWYKAEKLTEQMKTACVGRFLIDLPASMDFSYSHTFMTGLWVAAIPESEDAFLQRVSAREAEINSQPNELGANTMEKVDPVSVHGFSGKIFTFGRTSVEGLEHGKTVYYVNVALEGYVHAKDTTFTFKTEAIDPDQTNILGRLIEQLRVVAPDEIPSGAGFCFGRGMFVDPVPPDWTEGVTLFAGLREHPDLAIALSTRAGLGKDPNAPGLLARDARSDSELSLDQQARLSKIRIGHRTINGIAGEEVLEHGLELNFVQVYSFDWEAFGTKDNVFVPGMHLELSTGHPVNAGSKPVSSFLNEAALLEVWDKISSSIRVRPTSPSVPHITDKGPSSPKLGDSALAGEICPETGWWQCAEGGDGVSMADGQRQFLLKGQRMPQALLLPAQSAWDRLRRVQPICTNATPIAWTLVDRRSKARVSPDVQLAPAVAQAAAPARFGDDTNGTPANVGSFVRTGTPCPAAGWWQCHDSDALDGTRWFAKGDLLPAATFRLAQRRFFIAGRPDAVFQRRSIWQLVREQVDQERGNG